MSSHRTQFKKTQIVKDILEDLDYEDYDLSALLYEKAMIAEQAKESQQAKERIERWRQYFYGGTCIEHDREGCNECRHHAAGRCPSYWEEW